MAQHGSILVFSNNKESISIYESFGRASNFIIKYAPKDVSSLNILMLQKFTYIIIEIMYPAMTEIEFIETIYKFEKKTPIIVVSSYFYETKDILFGDKIASFIHKPFSFENLLHAVVSLVKTEEEKEASIPVKDPDYEFRKLSVLFEISRTINAKTNLDELLQLIIKLSTNAFDCERATVFILDSEKQELLSKVGTGLELQEIRIKMNRGIAGEVAFKGLPMLINNAYSHPKFNKDIDLKTGFKTKSILCVPMKNLKGEITGVFQLLNKRKGEFIHEDEEFLSAIATSTGIALENALLTIKLKKQIEGVKAISSEQVVTTNETRSSVVAEVIEVIKNVFKRQQEKKNEWPELIKHILIEKIKEAVK